MTSPIQDDIIDWLLPSPSLGIRKILKTQSWRKEILAKYSSVKG
jgi:hypothetical protein